MATQDDVRRIALALPETPRRTATSALSSMARASWWTWPNASSRSEPAFRAAEAVGIRIAHDFEKEALIEIDPAAFFTEPHYDGFPAILVRLDAVDMAMLEKLIGDAWRIQAPKRLLKELDARDSA